MIGYAELVSKIRVGTVKDIATLDRCRDESIYL